MPSDMTPEQAAEAMAFLDSAARNWGDLPPLSRDDLNDLSFALRTYGDQRAAEARKQALREAVKVLQDGIGDFSDDPHTNRDMITLSTDYRDEIRALLNVRPEVKPSGPFSMVSNVR